MNETNMQLSNDVKWNKIQQIMQFLVVYEASQYSYYWDCMSIERADKLARRDTWELANQIYDVLVDGLDDMTEYDPDDEFCLPYHYSDVIEVIFELSQFTTTDKWKYVMRNRHWELYDYNNS